MSYFGKTQAQQVAWAQNFFTVANLDPEAAGLTQALVDDFGAVNTILQAAWTKIQEPTTRTKVTVTEFRTALKDMRAMAGNLVSIIQGTPSVTDAMKVALNVTVRDKTKTRIPRPDVSPQISVRSVIGRSVSIELQHDGKRGKAPHATAATVFAHIGAQPQDVADWKYASATTRTRLTIPFPPSTTGDTVWFCAQWRNAKDESGPASSPISVNLPAGVPLPGEMEDAA